MPKLNDLAGQRFGKLCVIERDSSVDSNGEVRWKCLCDCGNYHVVRGQSLVHGRTKNCVKCSSSSFKDISGEHFGALIALKRVENNRHGNARWLCKCVCGKEKVIDGLSLRKGLTKSCGCHNGKYGNLEDHNISGRRFGKLVAIKPIGRNKKYEMLWECKCDCGEIKIVNIYRLLMGTTVSCGCFNKEKSTRHNLSHSPEYKAWMGMRQRCNSLSHRCYADYGGRGIKVCKEWDGKDGFQNFIRDMGFRPSSEFSIDRIDNNGGYMPSNCR